MKPMRKLALFAGVILLLQGATGTCWAASWFVATNGDDANTGCVTNPWRTVNNALSQALPGDSIFVGAGQFSEWLAISTPVTLCGSDGYNPDAPPLARHQSCTIITPPSTNYPNTALILVNTTNVVIQSLSIIGDADSNGIPDVEYGIYSTYRPLNVNHCVISTIGGYGICSLGQNPPPAAGDTDAVRGYFGYNLITNITSTNGSSGTGILLNHAPATCEYNEIASVSGINANAGLYVASCYYTSNMTDWVTIDYNYFTDCTMALWLNKFGTDGEKINIRRNTITNSVIGIRISASKGQALVENNHVSVAGVTPLSNAVPARGIWLQADLDPWDTNLFTATDHSVTGNTVIGVSTSADNTVGMMFQYDITPSTTNNNGVRATAIFNTARSFDYGAYVKYGTNDVSKPHDPLVEVVLNYNDFVSNVSYGVYTCGGTNFVNAVSNWWGSTNGPFIPYANPVSTNVNYIPWIGFDVALDTDDDGIPDWLDPDIDGDGMLNWQEIIAGTDPSNALSVFKIAGDSWSTGSGFLLAWPSATGRTYTIYRATNLLDGVWNLLATRAATAPSNSYTDTGAVNHVSAFYRITVTN